MIIEHQTGWTKKKKKVPIPHNRKKHYNKKRLLGALKIKGQVIYNIKTDLSELYQTSQWRL